MNQNKQKKKENKNKKNDGKISTVAVPVEDGAAGEVGGEIGRASCRERV